MIYAVYRRGSADLPWTRCCTADKKSTAQMLKKSAEASLRENGYADGEAKVEEFEAYADAPKTL